MSSWTHSQVQLTSTTLALFFHWPKTVHKKCTFPLDIYSHRQSPRQNTSATSHNGLYRQVSLVTDKPVQWLVLQIEVDNQCSETSRLTSQVLSTELTIDGPVYHTWSAHLCRAKLTTCCDNRYAVSKFSKYRTKFQWEVSLLLRIPEWSYKTV